MNDYLLNNHDYYCYNVANKSREKNQPILIICKDIQEANITYNKCKNLCDINTTLLFEDQEILPYDIISVHPDIKANRSSTLLKIKNLKQGVVICSVNNLMTKLPPAKSLYNHNMNIKIDQEIKRDEIIEQLVAQGYYNSDEVSEFGQFTKRGSILDIFPLNSKDPIRIDWFDDTIDSISLFNPITQRTNKKLKHITITAANDYLSGQQTLDTINKMWDGIFNHDINYDPFVSAIKNGKNYQGAERYLAVCYEQLDSLIDYLPPSTEITYCADIKKSVDKFWQLCQMQYHKQNGLDKAEPKHLYFDSEQVISQINKREMHIDSHCTKDQLIVNNLEQLNNLIMKEKSNNILISCKDTADVNYIMNNIDNTIQFNQNKNLSQQFANNKIIVGTLGFEDGFKHKKVVIAIYKDKAEYSLEYEKQNKKSENKQHFCFLKIDIGDLVVHRRYGVGKYLGLQTYENDPNCEMIEIEYADDQKLFINTSQSHELSYYQCGIDDHDFKLDKLGKKANWSKKAEKVWQKAKDLACELIEVAANRKKSKGIKIEIDNNLLEDFRQTFLYQETKDQISAIKDILIDLQSEQSMDRLICGDVGFGKTEVAMRAAFCTLSSGFQVALIVPTTILADQHFNNNKLRMQNFGINTEILTSSTKNKAQIIKDLKSGKIDFIIGTTSLIGKSIEFNNLGMIIIDEEHQFGTNQKNKLQKLKQNINVLSMSATPIPKTLSTALSPLRDLSLINTPPKRRLSVKTILSSYNEDIITNAINRELLRQGQIYFLHNDISTLEDVKTILLRNIPSLRIIISHGQLTPKELEVNMHNFYLGKYDLVLCTTIIESGIDHPNANTIIINRADKFGMAQLHQLRGRVGRSHHQGYAYLLVPNINNLQSRQERRLKALTKHSHLGAGFELAMQDLEIRGAGSLLGKEQSGHITDVGYNLYMEILDKAITNTDKNMTLDDLFTHDVDINLPVPSLIPKSYIEDPTVRLNFYHSISHSQDHDLEAISNELIDRFGKLPVECNNLFKIKKDFRL